MLWELLKSYYYYTLLNDLQIVLELIKLKLKLVYKIFFNFKVYVSVTVFCVTIRNLVEKVCL